MCAEEKKGRGRPPASLKTDARRVCMKIRWTQEEIDAVRYASHDSGENVSEFIRNAAVARAKNGTL